MKKILLISVSIGLILSGCGNNQPQIDSELKNKRIATSTLELYNILHITKVQEGYYIEIKKDTLVSMEKDFSGVHIPIVNTCESEILLTNTSPISTIICNTEMFISAGKKKQTIHFIQ